jgi:hypothetical protein
MRKFLSFLIALAAVVGTAASSLAQVGGLPGPGSFATSGGGGSCTGGTRPTSNFIGGFTDTGATGGGGGNCTNGLGGGGGGGGANSGSGDSGILIKGCAIGSC